MNFEEYKGLFILKTSDAIESAKVRINDERSGEQMGVYSPWHKLNNAMLKYFRFNQVTMLAGMSGSGKSFILNMLRSAFLDVNDWKIPKSSHIYLGKSVVNLDYDASTDSYFPCNNEDATCLLYPESNLIEHFDDVHYYYHRAVNRRCKFPVVLVHFGFEMEPEDELVRSASTVMGASFGYLMSSDTIEVKEGETSKQVYNRISDGEYETICEVLDSFKGKREYYVPLSGNVQQIEDTIKAVVALNPTAKVIVTLDHTLLSKKLTEKDDMELQAAIAELAIKVRQNYGAMVILLSQLNQNIEKPDRREKPVLHYPVKSDIHLGAQIWWACDNVMIWHRPKLLNISNYGQDKLLTDKLVHCAVVKSRRGRTGDIYFEEDFAHGRIHERFSGFFKPDKKLL